MTKTDARSAHSAPSPLVQYARSRSKAISPRTDQSALSARLVSRVSPLPSAFTV